MTAIKIIFEKDHNVFLNYFYSAFKIDNISGVLLLDLLFFLNMVLYQIFFQYRLLED